MSAAITSHIDVAQLALYAFWLFFAALIFYIRREDRREGYPLVYERTGEEKKHGYIWIPEPKVWTLAEGGTEQAPRAEVNEPPLKAVRNEAYEGAPYDPTGNPLVDGFGPAAFALRADRPDMTIEGEPKVVPLGSLSDFDVKPLTFSKDPRGMDILSADNKVVGTIKDLWIDRSEQLVRYVEIELDSTYGKAADGNDGAKVPRTVLAPLTLVNISPRLDLENFKFETKAKIHSINADQFADVPTTKASDRITLLEEDKVSAYFTGGHFFNRFQKSSDLS
ncbi:MAG: photosynthetic reaction center subunit H [Pseudomonadota bacterium]